MKTQPILPYFQLFLILSFLSLGSCKDDNYDPAPKDTDSGILTDIEGNVYTTVVIGDQVWIASNLITAKYSDGSAIDYPELDTLAWLNNTNGAYAWHSNNVMFRDSYGGLYNWHAVNDTRGLCPAGWRVSTAEDWNIMLKYLFDEHGYTNDYSGDKHAGTTLKSCRQIDSPLGGDCETAVHPRWEFHATHNGTDDFGFSAFPGGGRGSNGQYHSMGYYGFWWAHDPINDTDSEARHRYINFDQNRVYGMHKVDKNSGLSVRCVKN